MPVPSRSGPSVRELRASRTACALTFTTESESTVSCDSPCLGPCAASAPAHARPSIAMPSARRATREVADILDVIIALHTERRGMAALQQTYPMVRLFRQRGKAKRHGELCALQLLRSRIARLKRRAHSRTGNTGAVRARPAFPAVTSASGMPSLQRGSPDGVQLNPAI